MTENVSSIVKSSFTVNSLDDEIRVNRLCKDLLKKFHSHLLRGCQLEPLDAGAQAAGADYFLLDFIIDNQQINIFSTTADQIRKFAGNWYIINNLEPNIEELAGMLKGTDSFFCYCATHQLIEPQVANEISAACADLDYYANRIESFHAISGDGYSDWEQECPLK